MRRLYGARNSSCPTTTNTSDEEHHRREERRCWRSLEGLVDAEVRDGQPQRIDEHHGVRNLVAEHERDLRDERLALLLLPAAGAVVDLLEVHGRLVRRVLELVERDVLDLDLDLVAMAGQERLDGLRALVLGDRGVRQRGVEEVQRLRVALFRGGAHAGEVLRHELREEVLELRRLALRPVRQRSRTAPPAPGRCRRSG